MTDVEAMEPEDVHAMREALEEKRHARELKQQQLRAAAVRRLAELQRKKDEEKARDAAFAAQYRKQQATREASEKAAIKEEVARAISQLKVQEETTRKKDHEINQAVRATLDSQWKDRIEATHSNLEQYRRKRQEEKAQVKAQVEKARKRIASTSNSGASSPKPAAKPVAMVAKRRTMALDGAASNRVSMMLANGGSLTRSGGENGSHLFSGAQFTYGPDVTPEEREQLDRIRRFGWRWKAKVFVRKAVRRKQKEAQDHAVLLNRQTAAALVIQKTWRGQQVRISLDKLQRQARRPSVFFLRQNSAKQGVPSHYPYVDLPFNDNSITMSITSISLDLLIARVMQPHVDDATLVKLVLMTHTNFIPSVDLLEYIRLRFHSSPDEATASRADIHLFSSTTRPDLQNKVLAFIRAWLTHYVYHFADDRELYTKLREFLGNALSDARTNANVLQEIKNLQEYLEKQIEAYPAAYTTHSDGFAMLRRAVPAPILPTGDVTMMMHIHPVEVARQLTLLDFGIFKKIRAREFLKQAWYKPGKELKATHLCMAIDRFNQITNWASTEILRSEDLEGRVETICRLILTADACHQLNNFNALMGLVSALQSAPISRLKYTWEYVPEEFQAKFKVLNDVMSLNYNYRNYREKLQKVAAPAVPYLGVFLQDLTFIDDGNNDKIGEMVNLDKHRMTSNVVNDLFRVREGTEYALQPVDIVEQYLQRRAEIWPDKKQYDVSLEREPRGAKFPKHRPIRPTCNVTDVEDVVPAQDQDLDSDFVEEMLPAMTREHYRAGQYIVRINETGTCMYFVASGMCEVLFPTGGSKLMSQGAFFGEIALFLNTGLRTASIRAHTEVDVYVLPKEVCDEKLRKYPKVQQAFQALGEARLKADSQADKSTTIPSWMRRLAQKTTGQK